MQKQEDGNLESSQNKNYSLDKNGIFIQKAQNVHGNKYNYSKINYINSYTPVEIVCELHGSFFQTPNKHLSAKTGCPTCAKERHKQKCQTIKRNNIQNVIKNYERQYPQYTYSIVGSTIQVCCKEHGITVLNYLPGNNNTYPCKKCGIQIRTNKLVKDNLTYIQQAKIVHNNLYEYTEENGVLYAICKIHGKFPLQGNIKQNHINRKSGCVSCKKERLRKILSTEITDFIKKANQVHNFKYNYNKTIYVNMHTKVKIICKKHGMFEQTPINHLQGAGCPRCNFSKGEQLCRTMLLKYNIEFEEQKTFEQCINPLTNKKLRFDFYIPAKKILIEIDGKHHFQPVVYSRKYNVKTYFENTIYRDIVKQQFANNNGFKLFRIPYDNIIDLQSNLEKIIINNII